MEKSVVKNTKDIYSSLGTFKISSFPSKQFLDTKLYIDIKLYLTETVHFKNSLLSKLIIFINLKRREKSE